MTQRGGKIATSGLSLPNSRDTPKLSAISATWSRYCIQYIVCKPFWTLTFLNNIVGIYRRTNLTKIAYYYFSDGRINRWQHLLKSPFNGHYTSWTYKNNSVGVQIHDVAAEYNDVSLNKGEHINIKLAEGIWQKEHLTPHFHYQIDR